jgi:hypothetical protein
MLSPVYTLSDHARERFSERIGSHHSPEESLARAFPWGGQKGAQIMLLDPDLDAVFCVDRNGNVVKTVLTKIFAMSNIEEMGGYPLARSGLAFSEGVGIGQVASPAKVHKPTKPKKVKPSKPKKVKPSKPKKVKPSKTASSELAFSSGKGDLVSQLVVATDADLEAVANKPGRFRALAMFLLGQRKRLLRLQAAVDHNSNDKRALVEAMREICPDLVESIFERSRAIRDGVRA